MHDTDTNTDTDTERKYSVFYLSAPTGDVRAARGLVSRALRSVLGSDCYRSPHFVDYEARCVDTGKSVQRYSALLTDGEFDAVCAKATEFASAEGWSGTPVDAYND